MSIQVLQEAFPGSQAPGDGSCPGARAALPAPPSGSYSSIACCCSAQNPRGREAVARSRASPSSVSSTRDAARRPRTRHCRWVSDQSRHKSLPCGKTPLMISKLHRVLQGDQIFGENTKEGSFGDLHYISIKTIFKNKALEGSRECPERGVGGRRREGCSFKQSSKGSHH